MTSVDALPYTIVGPQEESRRVELWSVRRLPFEPTGWMKELRGELQEAIRSLPVQADDILHATYTSSEDTFVDVENVLFYNVGTGCFAKVGSLGLRFERVFASAPKSPTALGGSTLHHHRYETAPQSGAFDHWERGETLASWTAPSIPLRPQPSAAFVWLRMKVEGEIKTLGESISSAGFGMTVTIHQPRGKALNLPAVIKPLLDGVIAALHSHDGSALEDVSNRLAGKLATSSNTVARALMDAQHACLGQRTLVHPFQQFVQWNPADDRLVAADIVVDRNTNERPWSLSGELFLVQSRSPI